MTESHGEERLYRLVARKVTLWASARTYVHDKKMAEARECFKERERVDKEIKSYVELLKRG